MGGKEGSLTREEHLRSAEKEKNGKICEPCGASEQDGDSAKEETYVMPKRSIRIWSTGCSLSRTRSKSWTDCERKEPSQSREGMSG
jgi:hypothetical protein